MAAQSKSNVVKLSIIPNRTFYATSKNVQLSKIPSLATKTNPQLEPSESVFVSPTGPLMATSNPDGTYSLMNDLRMLEPEISRMNPMSVQIWLLEPDQDDLPLREYFAYVAPCRAPMNSSEFCEAFLAGALTTLPNLYRSDRRTQGTYAQAKALNPNLVRSTFQGSKRASKQEETVETTNEQSAKPDGQKKSETGKKGKAKNQQKASNQAHKKTEKEPKEPKPTKKNSAEPKTPPDQGKLF